MYTEEKKSEFEIALHMLKEEMEAVNAYNWCITNCTDPELISIMKDNLITEKAHANALLRWVNRVAPAALA